MDSKWLIFCVFIFVPEPDCPDEHSTRIDRTVCLTDEMLSCQNRQWVSLHAPCPAYTELKTRLDYQMRIEFALHASLHPPTFFRTHSTGNGTSLTLSQKGKFNEENIILLIFNISNAWLFYST